METYYPQCWIQLYIRPEDYVAPPAAPDARVPKDPVIAAGYLPFGHAIVPEECSVSLRSFREGDEAKFTIPWESLPLDPRTVRSIAVHIYMGSLTPSEFAQSQGTLGARGKMIRLPQVDPTTGMSNEVFRGFADDMDITLGEDNTFEIKCRDITGFFIDAELPTGAIHGIPANTPIDKVIEAIIDGDTAGQALTPNMAVMQNKSVKDVVGSKAGVRRKRAQLVSLQAKVDNEFAYNALLLQPEEQTLEALAVLNQLIIEIGGELSKEVAKETAVAVAAAWPSRIGLPGARGVVVVNETGDDPMPSIDAVKATWSDSKKTLKKGSKGGGANEKVSYWDFITDMCVSSGYICFFRNPVRSDSGPLSPVELVISTPRTYYGLDALPGPLSGVASVTGLNDEHLFEHGRNVDSMNIRRSFAGQNVPKHIRVRAESAVTGQPINVVYPPLNNAKTTRSTGNGRTGSGDNIEVNEWLMNDSIPGPDPEAVLLRMAKGLFEQMSKGEMELTVETDTLNARPSNRGSGKIDMLHLRAADPIKIGVLSTQTPLDNNTFVTSYGDSEAMPDAVRLANLININKLHPELAAAIVNAERNPKLQKIFRVQKVDIEFGAEDGFKFTIDAMSYLDARAGLQE